tara:strand:+ start:982 stop:1161 length:180 start_codon:yes stop_codon:yes gene_type:complete
MKTYQIIIQSDKDIDGIDFQSQDGESAKVISIIDISNMYNKEVVEYIKDFNVSDDIGEA